jgi:hypothetical protein
MIIRVELSQKDYEALQQLAYEERRPLRDQAEWLIIQGLRRAEHRRREHVRKEAKTTDS